MRRPLAIFAVVATLLAVVVVRADYLEVRRNALIKTDHHAEAPTIRPGVIGEHLPLANPDQEDGYYPVTLDTGEQGWIYRTMVRRFPGDAPAGGGSTRTSTVGGPAAIAAALLSPHAYAGIPVQTDADFPVRLLAKPYFAIGYSDERKDPLWVCYTIGAAVDLKAYKSKRFVTDTETTARVSYDDYTKSGYSRGHMAPRMAISSRYGKAGNDATFVMSNVCPQFQAYNDGQWGNLEEWVAGRKLRGGKFIKGWADEYGPIWVTVGPIFDEDRDPLESGVEVPTAFYCIVIDEEAGKPRALAFILEHVDEREGDLKAALHSIDDVEERTGLDFFVPLPDDFEAQLEAMVASDLWPLPVNPN